MGAWPKIITEAWRALVRGQDYTKNSRAILIKPCFLCRITEQCYGKNSLNVAV